MLLLLSLAQFLIRSARHALVLSFARNAVHATARGAEEVAALFAIRPALAVRRQAVKGVRQVGLRFAEYAVQSLLPFLLR